MLREMPLRILNALNLSFGAKASIGMVVFALAPCWCAYSLMTMSKQGTIRKSDRSIIERHARVDNPFAKKE